MNSISDWFFRLAVIYLIAGVCLGMVMGASGDHSLRHVHAHVNLLGWVTLALFGGFYRLWPQAAQGRLAQVHFWLYVPAHFAQMVAVLAVYRGAAAMFPVLAAADVIVALAILVFAVNVWRHTGAKARRSVPETETMVGAAAR